MTTDAANDESVERLLARHSVGPKYLGDPGPTSEQLRRAVAVSLRAPDHGKLFPFRFVVVRGAALVRLATLFVDYGARHGKSEEDLAMERKRAMQAPVVIAVVARIHPEHEVPVHEQWIAVGGAITNMLNALHLMGYGAKMLSGLRAADPEITRAFCEGGERLVGWISTGTATVPPKARSREEVDSVLREF
jgi:nitroreductase